MKSYKVSFNSKKSQNEWGTTKITEQTINLADGRPVKIQKWMENGFKYMTYFFPIEEGTEDKTKEELFNYLTEQGIMFEQSYSEGKISCQKFLDETKKPCWGLTIIVGKIEV